MELSLKPARRPLPGSREHGRNDLNRLAQLYLDNPHIERIELFGSFARGVDNWYSDYDLIIVAEEYYAQVWLEAVFDRDADFSDDEDGYARKAIQRWDASYSLFNITGAAFRPSDIFVFPPNWRDEDVLERLQAAGRHEDGNFMKNIAGDAIVFDPTTGSFPWPN